MILKMEKKSSKSPCSWCTEAQSLQSDYSNSGNMNLNFRSAIILCIQQPTEENKQPPSSLQPFPQRRRWFEFEVQTKNVQMLARVENAQSKGRSPNQIDSIRLTHTKASSSRRMNDCNMFTVDSVTALLPGLVPPTGCQSQPQGTKVSKILSIKLPYGSTPVVSPSGGNHITMQPSLLCSLMKLFIPPLIWGFYVFH